MHPKLSRFYFSSILFICFILVSFSSAVEESPGQGIEGIFQYAESLFKNQQYAAAETEYLQFLSLDSKYISADSAFFRLGWCAYYQHKYELAVEQFTCLIRAYPKSLLIKEAQQMRQFIYETTSFIPTVDSDPAIVPFNLAKQFQGEQNDLAAIDFYERVVQNYPASIYAPYSAYFIAQIHESNYWKLYGSYTEKNMVYQQAQLEKSDPAFIIQSFAEEALQEELTQQQLQQTIFAYSRVTATYPESFQRQLTHRDLGNLYLRINRRDAAKKEYSYLLEICREFPNSLLAYQAQEKLKLLK